VVLRFLEWLEYIQRVLNSDLSGRVFEERVHKCETQQVDMKSESLCELVEQVSVESCDKFQNFTLII